MKEIMYNDETVKIFDGRVFTDENFWGMNAQIEFRGEYYRLYDEHSCDDDNSICKSGITKIPFDRLYSDEQVDVDNHDREYFKETILMLLDYFIDSGANIDWSCTEYDYSDYQISVDGVEQWYEWYEEES